MLDALRHDAELTRLERGEAVAQMDVSVTVEDEEHLVLLLVRVPDVLVLRLGDPVGSETRTTATCGGI